MGNRQDPFCAGGLGGFVCVSAFGWGNERKSRKLSQNCTRFTCITLIVNQVFKNGSDISVLQLLY